MPSKLQQQRHARHMAVRSMSQVRGTANVESAAGGGDTATPLAKDMLLHRHVQFDMSKNVCWTLPSKKALKRAAARAEGFNSSSHSSCHSEDADDGHVSEEHGNHADAPSLAAGRDTNVSPSTKSTTATHSAGGLVGASVGSASARQAQHAAPLTHLHHNTHHHHHHWHHPAEPHHSILKSKRNPNCDAELLLARQNRTLNLRSAEIEASRRDMLDMAAHSGGGMDGDSSSSSSSSSSVSSEDDQEDISSTPLSPEMSKALAALPAKLATANAAPSAMGKAPGKKSTRKKSVPAGLVDEIMRGAGSVRL